MAYPTKEDLEAYKDELSITQFRYLPPLDERWADDMHVMFDLVHMLPGCSHDFPAAAANLFFKIAKNHRRYDGNKRSAICCLIYFTLLNNRKSEFTSQEIEDLALEVASSTGNTQDDLLPRLQTFFQQKLIENVN